MNHTKQLENELLALRSVTEKEPERAALDHVLAPVQNSPIAQPCRPGTKKSADYPDRAGEQKAGAWNAACEAHTPYIALLESQLAHWKACATAYGETAVYLQADRNRLREDLAHTEFSLERHLGVSRTLRSTISVQGASFEAVGRERDQLQLRNQELKALLTKYSARGLSPLLTEAELEEIDKVLAGNVQAHVSPACGG